MPPIALSQEAYLPTTPSSLHRSVERLAAAKCERDSRQRYARQSATFPALDDCAAALGVRNVCGNANTLCLG